MFSAYKPATILLRTGLGSPDLKNLQTALNLSWLLQNIPNAQVSQCSRETSELIKAPDRVTTDASPTGAAGCCAPPNRLRSGFRGSANRRRQIETGRWSQRCWRRRL